MSPPTLPPLLRIPVADIVSVRATNIVAYLSGHGEWTAAFVIGAVFSLAGAAAWLGIDADHPFSCDEAGGAQLLETAIKEA